MVRQALCSVVLLLAAILALAGCSRRALPRGSGDESTRDDASVEAVSPPAGLVGKWRRDVKEGTSSRTSVYRVLKGGRLEVESRLVTTEGTVIDVVKRVIVAIEGDKITIVDLSHTGAEGVEDIIPPTRRRRRTIRYRVVRDELHWSEVDEKGKPRHKPWVLKRMKTNSGSSE